MAAVDWRLLGECVLVVLTLVLVAGLLIMAVEYAVSLFRPGDDD